MSLADLVIEFKDLEKMDDYTGEDKKIERMLSSSYEWLKSKCGYFELSDEKGKELILMRTRYAYQDLLEYFNDNYREDIIELAFSVMEVPPDETII